MSVGVPIVAHSVGLKLVLFGWLLGWWVWDWGWGVAGSYALDMCPSNSFWKLDEAQKVARLRLEWAGHAWDVFG